MELLYLKNERCSPAVLLPDRPPNDTSPGGGNGKSFACSIRCPLLKRLEQKGVLSRKRSDNGERKVIESLLNEVAPLKAKGITAMK